MELYGLAFGINDLQLTLLAKSRFQRTYVKPLTRRAGLRCRFYFDLVPLYLLLSTGASYSLQNGRGGK